MQTAEKEPGQAEIFKSGDRLLDFDLSEELNHGIAVSNLAYAVAAELGQDEEFCYQMAIAGMLHDIGKLKLTGYINGQENDPLLIEELKYVRMHSSLGYEELKDQGYSELVLQSVLYHHENYDGSGYPSNLRGDSIPLGARILRVCDVYAALSSDRPYRKACDVSTVIELMIDEIKKVDGVKLAVSMDSLTGPMVPQDVIPDDVKDIFKSGDYQMMVIVSEYASATDEVNKQCDEINAIIKKYDNTAMLIGEAPCTKDLIEITDVDFKNVSIISIAAIFIIILLTFKSISLPIILVCVIEFAIFINMGIPAYTGTVLPFIASIVIGTIQLGATVDYAILMTNKYKKNRFRGMDKKEAITDALSKSIQSIIVSALSFFAATFGVGLYSNIDMIGSLCMLMARGAIISMIVVIFILPSMFMVFDRVICASSAGFRNKIK